jgi:Kinesin motor domain
MEEIEAGHMNELKNINLSLTTLGKVINLLAKDSAFVPYRDSNLTRLLQDSFSGGTKTLLIATISPSQNNVEETISTLKFADRAKNVMQRVRKTELNVHEDATVNKLQREISFLKEVLMLKQKGTVNEMSSKVIRL